MNKRNGTIDFLKFVFSIIIVLFHGRSFYEGNGKALFEIGSLSVDFFFIVSGYMMANSFFRKNNTGVDIGNATFEFIKRKICMLMPNYYVAWFVAFFSYHICVNELGIKLLIKHLGESFPELLMISMSGMIWTEYNGVTWYLSAMLLSMFVIYPLMMKYGNAFFKIIAPVLFVFCMGYICKEYDRLSGSFAWNGLVYNGVVRSFGELLGGCICYCVSSKIKRYNYTKLVRIALSVFEAFLLGTAIMYMQFGESSKYDFLYLFIIMALVIIATTSVSYDVILFDNTITKYLGEYSFNLYLGHIFIRNIFVRRGLYKIWGYNKSIMIYLLVVIFCSLVIMYLSKGLRILWNRFLPNIKKLVIVSSEY